jgi:hypothetical protein
MSTGLSRCCGANTNGLRPLPGSEACGCEDHTTLHAALRLADASKARKDENVSLMTTAIRESKPQSVAELRILRIYVCEVVVGLRKL